MTSENENSDPVLKKLYETKMTVKVMCVERHQRSKVGYLPKDAPACKWGHKRGGVKASTCSECDFAVRVAEPAPKHRPADVLEVR